MNIIQEIEEGLTSVDAETVDVSSERINGKLNEWRDGKKLTNAMQAFMEWYSAKSGTVTELAFEILENVMGSTKDVDALIMEFKINHDEVSDDDKLAFMMMLDSVNKYRSESMTGLYEHYRSGSQGNPVMAQFFGGDELWADDFIALAEDLPTYVGRSGDSLKEGGKTLNLIDTRSKSLRFAESTETI